jgi:SAM-dependent methyltransferase
MQNDWAWESTHICGESLRGERELPSGRHYNDMRMSHWIERRFHLGAFVDRVNPHIFHQDYWHLRQVRQGVEEFVRRYGSEIRGGQAVDYGAGRSPYTPFFEAAGCQVLPANLEQEEPHHLKIGPDGRVPVEDASMAAVISTQVLEHVAEPRPYLQEVFRMLRPGGVFLLTTHGAWPYHPIPGDYHRWTLQGLVYECTQVGLIVESCEPCGGILAHATHLRSTVLGGMLRRIPVLGYARLLVYFLSNIRMGLEDLITPKWLMKSNPELLILYARKPAQ